MNLQKTYLSRAMTRAMALDHPIGDPYGGPAYGERRDPVSAIVAVASMAASAGGAAALIGGTITLGTVAAGLAFAGGAMSLVGNATGNKDLMKIGTIASLAGGIGGFFDAAGFAGNVAKEAAGAAAGPGSAGWGMDLGTDAVAASGSTAAPSVSESILGAANPEVIVNAAPAQSIAAPTQLADTSALVAQAPAGAAAAPGAAPLSVADDIINAGAGSVAGQTAGLDAGSMIGASGSTPLAADLGMDLGLAQPQGVLSSANPTLSTSAQTPGMSFDSFGNPAPVGSPAATMADPSGLAQTQVNIDAAAAKAGGGGWFDKAKSLMPDTSKMSTMDKWMAMKIGGDVVGGITNYVAPSPETQAKTQAAQAAATANQAQADKIRADEELRQRRINAMRQNMAMGINMGTVNPNAVQISGPTLRTQGGLINSARTNA